MMTQAETRIEQIDKEVNEFQEKIKVLLDEKEELLKKGKGEKIAEMKKVMTLFRIASHELSDEKQKSKTRKAKPKATIEAGRTFSNGAETWTSGRRGQRPLWVSQALKAGTLDSLAVQ